MPSRQVKALCRRKRRYRTQERAQVAAQEIHGHTMYDRYVFTAYRCPNCRGYHVGHRWVLRRE
jgi:hypothetical protein